MIIFIWGTILLLNILAVLCKKKDVRILRVVDYVFIFLMMAGNSENADALAYKYEYINALKGTFQLRDVGYNFLQIIAHKYMGLSFYGFKAVVVVLSMIAIQKTINMLEANNHLVWGCYIGYQMFMDTIQFRNFLAFVLLSLAVAYFIKDEKYGTVKFCVLLFFACTLHISFLFYFIFLVFKLKNKKTIVKIFAGLGTAMFGFSYITRNSILQGFINLLFDGRGQGYFASRTHLSWALCVLLFIAEWFPILIGKIKKNICIYNEKEEKVLNNILYLNTCMLLVLPLLFFNVSFYRYYRNLILLNSVGYGVVMQKLGFRSARRAAVIVLIVVAVVLWFYTDFYLLNGYEMTLEPLWERNIFWGDDRVSESLINIFME